jgi:hypothetical protein
MYLVFLCIYFTWLALQNFVLPWAYQQRLLSASSVGILMASKEATLALAIIALSYRLFCGDWHWSMPDKFAAAYLFLLTVYLVLGPQLLGTAVPFALRIISWRAVAALALFYFWGRLSFFNFRELRCLLQFIVGLHIAIALFGLIEWLFLPTSFWSDTVGVGAFMLDVKGLLDNQNVNNGLPSNMFQFGIRRLMSTYAEPLGMGIASVFPLLVCAAFLLRSRSTVLRQLNRRNLVFLWKLAAAVIASALILTIGRESIGAALFGTMLLLWWSGKSERILPLIIVPLITAAFIPQFWTYLLDTITFHEASAATHLHVLSSSWQRVPKMIFGEGLGTAGGWAFSLAGVESSVGEDSYLELMAQTGACSVLLLFGFLFTTARSALRESRSLSDPLLSAGLLAAAAHIVARSLMAVFSPSLFAVVPLASFFFFCGASFSALQHSRSHARFHARRVLVMRLKTSADANLAASR